MADRAVVVHSILCCFFFFTLLLQCTEGATQNFSISGLSSLSPNRLPLTAYGDMQAYVAYMPSTADSQKPSAWLLFIPAIPSSNSSTFLLASLVFKQASQNQMGAIVWMANRHHPVSGNFSLSLDQSSGNLILLDGDGSLAWSSNVTSAPNGTVSMDLTTDPSGSNVPIGTLLLSDSANTTLWQSSDYPSHTLAPPQFFQPGMSLVSWTSTSDPSDGLYRLAMEAGGLALYYDGYPGSSLPYWLWSYYGRNDTYGITHTCINRTQAFMSFDGSLLLGLSDERSPEGLTSSDLCADADSSGSVATLQEARFSNYGTVGNDDIIILSLQNDGNLLAYSIGSPWTTVYDLFRDNRCLLPNFCGPYGICSAPSNCECPFSSDGSFPLTFPSNNEQGCQPLHALSCKDNNASLDTAGQRLLRYVGVDYFLNKYSASASLNLTSENACQDACLQNCSCLAAFWHDHTKSCFHASQFASSLQGNLNGSYIAFLKVEALAGESDSDRGSLVIGLVSGAVALVAVGVLVAALAIYYRKKHGDGDDGEEDEALWSHVPGLPRRFSYKQLQSITNNFSEQMGKGGFGTVYAGVLEDGTKVAVKQLESLRQGAKEFRAEVVILGGVHHYNLVELVGYCAEGSSHRLLVYEYMANGSLDQWLFISKDQQPLPWKHRFNIAVGAARGLAYLHEGCKNTVVHLDIKPPNILVDSNFVPKVSDFGLSTLIGRDETHVITTMRGTPGYLAPEWLAEGSEVSPKCDVFSFGKLLMELLGARKNFDPSLVEEQEKMYFPAWLYLRMTHEGGVQEAADLKHIAGVETLEEAAQAKRMMKTAFLCVLENPSQRPSMGMVVHMLEGHMTMLDDLSLSDLFQGLHFALRMPSPSLANDRIERALAFIFESSTSLNDYSKSGHSAYSENVSAR